MIIMELAMLLKLGQLVVKKKGNPEQCYKDWDNYMKVFKEFLESTGVMGDHADPEVCDWQQSLDKVSRGIKRQTQKSTSQGKQEDSRVDMLEEQVRRLQFKKPNSTRGCQTCTRRTHTNEECPGKKRQCFACGLVGHFRGSAACREKKVVCRLAYKMRIFYWAK